MRFRALVLTIILFGLALSGAMAAAVFVLVPWAFLVGYGGLVGKLVVKALSLDGLMAEAMPIMGMAVGLVAFPIVVPPSMETLMKMFTEGMK